MIPRPGYACAASCGAEVRYPLMDLDLIGFAFTTPARVLTGGFRKKHLLREAMCDLLPHKVRNHCKKPSFAEVIARDWNAIQGEVLRRPWFLEHCGILDSEGLSRLIGARMAEANSRGSFIGWLFTSELLARHGFSVASRVAMKN